MRNHSRDRTGRGRWPFPRVALLAALVAAPLAGCDTDPLLNVEDPTALRPEQLGGAASVPVTVAGATFDFTFAYSGGGLTDGTSQNVGMFTDEFILSGTFASRTEVDKRAIDLRTNERIEIIFRNLHQARRAADVAARLVETDIGADDARAAQMHSFAGYTTVAFAENFCSGVPLSNSFEPDINLAVGPQLTTAQMLDTAVAKFNRAQTIASAANSSRQLNLARIGQARALLSQDRVQDAAAVAANVPTTYVFRLAHSSTISAIENAWFNLNRSNRRYSQADNEAGEGLPFRAAMDPRTPWFRPGGSSGRGFDGSTPLFVALKFPNRDTDLPLATGVEARLIEAEAALRGGDAARWLAILNSLRADLATLAPLLIDDWERNVTTFGFPTTLPDLTDPGTQQERVALHFRERAFWLFGTGQRLADLRRMVRQYGFAPSSIYPSGDYFKGGSYGNQLAFPIPFDEENNPNFAGCLTPPSQA